MITKRLLVGAAVTFALLYLIGVLIETRREAQELRLYRPMGQMIEVNGRSAHVFCTGPDVTGQPNIILEAGLGDSLVTWESVQSEMSRSARVCSYDRAGYGWSDPGPMPRRADVIAEELHTLLNAAEIEGPYLLVGHSYGGLIARLFANNYPQEVVGLVLVDSTNADALMRLPGWLREAVFTASAVPTGLGAILESAGGLRLLAESGALETSEVLAQLPGDLQPQATALYYRAQTFATAYAEQTTVSASASIANDSGDLGDLPMVALLTTIEGNTQPRTKQISQTCQRAARWCSSKRASTIFIWQNPNRC